LTAAVVHDGFAPQARVKKFYELSERARDLPKDDVKVDLSAGPMLRQGRDLGSLVRAGPPKQVVQ
jgi:hypothetical protein